jgi:hypothetical protein
MAAGFYLTSTETCILAGLALRWLGPKISSENSSCPLYPGGDLYDTSGEAVEPFHDAMPWPGCLVIAIESMLDFPLMVNFIEHGAPLLTRIVAGDSEP